MEKVNKNYLLIILVIILVLGLGVSLAYWTATIVGEGSPMNFNSPNIKIIYDNKGGSIGSGIIEPGWSETKTFSVKNENDTPYTYNIILKDLINTFKTEGYLQYKISSTNGYNMPDYMDIPKSEERSNQVIGENITIEGNTTQEYTIEIIYKTTEEDQSADMGATLTGTLYIEEYRPTNTLYSQILKDHPIVNTRTDFDSAFGEDTPTTGVIYKESVYRETPESTGSQNNNKDVYYFAGNVADNWVEFGGYMWRIIRTNEDGSVRLLYHGTSTTATNSYTTIVAGFNDSINNPMYAGYMYGTEGSIENNRINKNSSEIKRMIDSWYKDNILNNYDGYVSKTAIYCNDRASSRYKNSGGMYYAAYERLTSSKRQPTYQCGQNTKGSPYASSSANVADRFSVSVESGGNGQLQYPIALMTADEVSFAGGLDGKDAPNTYYYLNSLGESSVGNRWWWILSPHSVNSISNHALAFRVHGSDKPGNLNNWGVSNPNAARPVLSLKSCVNWESGNGTPESPYKVSIDGTCGSTVN